MAVSNGFPISSRLKFDGRTAIMISKMKTHRHQCKAGGLRMDFIRIRQSVNEESLAVML
jgi:hypothetical protein